MSTEPGTWLVTGARPLGGNPADILIRGGVVDSIGGGAAPAGAQVVDAAGLIALPGLVDLHTHLREPGREDAETVLTGSRAAARGGFTAVHAMANTEPVADTAGVVGADLWRLGRQGRAALRRPSGRGGHRGPGRDAAGRAGRDGRVRAPGPGVLR